MAKTAPAGRGPASTPWWRDGRRRALVWQVAVLALLLLGLSIVIRNVLANLGRLGVPLSFDFLAAPAGFAISSSLIPTEIDSPIGRLIVAGMLNTLLVSIISIVLATVLGLVVGICRLSNHFLLSRIATTYVETLRNVPLLVQLLFWHVAILQLFPLVRNSISAFNLVFLNNRGANVPRPLPADGFGIVLIALAVGIVAAFGVARWARRRQEATGRQFPKGCVGLATVAALPLSAAFILGSPVTWDIPRLVGFNFQGGLVLQPEITALVLGLGTYTAAFIAEIVRGAVLAINRGQTEASYALGLRPGATLRLVVIPQALRVVLPPITSEYLNNVKNTTLAGAIAYPDLFSIIGTSLNQTGRAVENVAIVMGFFLVLSLAISLLMNWYNRRIALVDR